MCSVEEILIPPAEALITTASSAAALAVIVARPPSAQRSLASFQAKPIPPAVASKSIAPAPSEPVVLPWVLVITIVSLVP